MSPPLVQGCLNTAIMPTEISFGFNPLATLQTYVASTGDGNGYFGAKISRDAPGP
jgi:hypothetical protein